MGSGGSFDSDDMKQFSQLVVDTKANATARLQAADTELLTGPQQSSSAVPSPRMPEAGAGLRSDSEEEW